MEPKLIAIQPSNSILPSQKAIEPRLADIAFFIILNLVLLSAIAVPIYIFIVKRKRASFGFKPSPKVICHRCQYFSDNRYLKCALHPVTVLTEETVDCVDHRSINS
ncbi:hypothetical protein [Phormidium tenue]|uniref:Uncharacterized protein n=1 Tax=Phormidium tenue FACHB-1050 TaxID=2692857 RepID=A0ABR8C848_9CYAN|nr:hypothetical protein [Phormidium tenue]MBD2316540.1 hypothetical protein [Phormidium tenue FACHB-1050]